MCSFWAILPSAFPLHLITSPKCTEYREMRVLYSRVYLLHPCVSHPAHLHSSFQCVCCSNTPILQPHCALQHQHCCPSPCMWWWWWWCTGRSLRICFPLNAWQSQMHWNPAPLASQCEWKCWDVGQNAVKMQCSSRYPGVFQPTSGHRHWLQWSCFIIGWVLHHI